VLEKLASLSAVSEMCHLDQGVGSAFLIKGLELHSGDVGNAICAGKST
jgi:hypothetical protein